MTATKIFFKPSIKEECTYSIGDMFKISIKDDPGYAKLAILAQVEAGKCSLILLDSGNRQDEPQSVNDIFKVTDREMRSILGDDELLEFKKVDTVTIYAD